ncbi:MAG: CopG family transcriptional regulator [Methanomassiliicoccales archaeon]
MGDRVTIKIPKELYENLQGIIENTGFASVTEFIVFTMRSIASGGEIGHDQLTDREVEAIRERLRRLGYF